MPPKKTTDKKVEAPKKAAPPAKKTAAPATTKVPPPERKQKVSVQKSEKLLKSKKRQVVKRQKKADKDAEMVRRYYKYRRALRSQDRDLRNRRIIARAVGKYFVEAEPKVAFVIRIRGINGLAPKPRKILQILRLRQIFNGVFVRLNKASLTLLKMIAPYIAWGYPSRQCIRNLMYKRGYARFRGQRKRLNNGIIEKSLGKHKIICMEDMIHQLITCGKKFRETAKFLAPFQLSAPTGGLKAKRKHFIEGGHYGNREQYISKLIMKMV
eukprot:NODE_1265_length_999_cov_2388.564211_g971_i0.p1 GENE.NODE_1265_length_999_cov_2388.564211_g971_i0~~NODE_1265_length_999_cov_2388.564211_g971_i0.p1  ORF type:complete len:268 (+),score=58.55 NODE_1265_length_999_cov_2388.564211_g971_i0:88-891(+)